jgi:hypothetical protein
MIFVRRTLPFTEMKQSLSISRMEDLTDDFVIPRPSRSDYITDTAKRLLSSRFLLVFYVFVIVVNIVIIGWVSLLDEELFALKTSSCVKRGARILC